MDQIREKFDVIIIGGGVAGMSAAIWCSDLGLRSVILEKEPQLGGQLRKIYDPVTNYVGVRAENGTVLRDLIADQLAGAGAIIRTVESVEMINPREMTVSIGDGTTLAGRAIIVATGVRRRRLGVPGEREFAGRGVLESGAAARGLLTGKRVVVVGGGDAAFENANILAEDAELVTLLHRRSDFSARSEFLSRARKHPKIKIVQDVKLSKIFGNDAVEGVEHVHAITGEANTIAADAVLIRIGVVPNSENAPSEICLDDKGYFVVDRYCMTNIPLVFAVGDVAKPIAPTINGAAGDAATAVKAAYSLLASSKQL